ncbi:MAG TPA: ABC transporter permease [Gemmatimonadaceae bacterium]
MPDSPRWRRYLRFFGVNVQADVDDELAFHMEMRIRDYESQGMSRAEAEQAARERFGDVGGVHQQLSAHDQSRERHNRWRANVDRVGQDVRLALRGFRRTPGFFITAVIILGLGIGMSVAMFTVFRTVLVQRLPVVDQDRLVVMWTYGSDPKVDVSGGTHAVALVRQDSRTMRDIAAVAHWPASDAPFIDNGRTISLARAMVTTNYFDVLGVRPALGRLLHTRDDDIHATPPDSISSAHTLVISYRAWRQKFGGDSSVIGRRLLDPLAHDVYTIVGVAPPGFAYPAGAEYWTPMWYEWNSGVGSFAVARLAPGATVAAARDEYFSIESRAQPEMHFRGAHVATFTETVLGNVTPVLTVLLAAVAVLLLIACLNVGNLLLLRTSGRAREIAVRRALGARDGDIVRQLLVEAVTLATAGGALGFVIAVAALRTLVRLAPSNLPRLDAIQLSGAPLAAALVVPAIAVLAFGLAPALLATRTNLAIPLRFDSRSGNETRRRRAVRQTLVAAQVGLAMVMLGGASLLARSLARLETQDTGYNADHLSVLTYTWNAYRYDSLSRMLAFTNRLVANVQRVPGVTAVTPLIVPPLIGDAIWQVRFDKDSQTPTEAESNPFVPAEIPGPDFFRTFGVPLLRGRGFTDRDDASSQLVVVVSESFARRYWPSDDPIGKRIRMWRATPAGTIGGDAYRTVVGVARDTHLRTIRSSSPTVYIPFCQAGDWQGSIAIRSTVPLTGLITALRAAGHETDPETELFEPQTMDQLLNAPMSQPRLSALLMSSFGLIALVLAAIGLYGVMSAIVRDQTREIGIRVALGADASRVRWNVLRRAALLTGSGAMVGLAVVLVTSRLFASLLFDIAPTDPVALGGACLVLLSIGALAAYLPARRATRIDPVQALRAD